MADKPQPEEDDAKAFQVDETALQEEWVKQPRRYFRYARKLADAQLDQAEAKNRLNVTEAEAELEIRSDPARFGFKDKPTEAGVKARLVLHKKVQAAEKEVLEATHRVRVAEAAKEAMDHKKKALENLVTLWTQNYFSAPKDPGGAMDEAEKRATRRPDKRR